MGRPVLGPGLTSHFGRVLLPWPCSHRCHTTVDAVVVNRCGVLPSAHLTRLRKLGCCFFSCWEISPRWCGNTGHFCLWHSHQGHTEPCWLALALWMCCEMSFQLLPRSGDGAIALLWGFLHIPEGTRGSRAHRGPSLRGVLSAPGKQVTNPVPEARQCLFFSLLPSKRSMYTSAVHYGVVAGLSSCH